MIDLPAISYAKHQPDGRTVVILRHEPGFRDFVPKDPTADLDMDVDRLNAAAGVSRAQAAAMFMGSMFGWDTPGANPNNYDENGHLRKR